MHNKKMIAERRAISPVISNLILVAGVIAVGFAVLAYINSNGSIFAQEYGRTVTSDINTLKERLAFEYVFYNSTTRDLSLYLLNYGAINNVNLSAIYLGNSSWHTAFSGIQLRYFNGTEASALNIGEEGYCLLPPTTLVSGKAYTVRITTKRGSVFGYTFVA